MTRGKIFVEGVEATMFLRRIEECYVIGSYC